MANIRLITFKWNKEVTDKEMFPCAGRVTWRKDKPTTTAWVLFRLTRQLIDDDDGVGFPVVPRHNQRVPYQGHGPRLAARSVSVKRAVQQSAPEAVDWPDQHAFAALAGHVPVSGSVRDDLARLLEAVVGVGVHQLALQGFDRKNAVGACVGD